MVDSDEFLFGDDVAALIRDEPPVDAVRLGPVAVYGAVDRVARGVHCCWKDNLSRLRDPRYRRSPDYVFAGPSLARAGATRNISPSSVRFQSPLVSRSRTVGMQATIVEPVDRVAWKLANMRHDWVPRVLDVQHLQTMLGAGVHHAGWWIAEYRKPEPWLRQLATDADLRLPGEPPPADHLRALRAGPRPGLIRSFRRCPSLPGTPMRPSACRMRWTSCQRSTSGSGSAQPNTGVTRPTSPTDAAQTKCVNRVRDWRCVGSDSHLPRRGAALGAHSIPRGLDCADVQWLCSCGALG